MVTLPRTPSFRLDGRRALVTGASSGIGLGCAAALAEAGAEVVMAARGSDRLEEAVAAVTAAGGNATPLVLDIADVAAINGSVAALGPFDVLVNSAGLARHTAALDTDPVDFDAVMSVNLRGAYFVSTAVARGLAAACRRGSLIHISSQMAHVGGPDRAVYCASKHAIEGFVKAMAIEWGKLGIRINTICPTFVRTPLTARTFAEPDRARWLAEKIKLGRVADIEDIMGAALYLAGDASAMVTGTALIVDGGWTAG